MKLCNNCGLNMPDDGERCKACGSASFGSKPSGRSDRKSSRIHPPETSPPFVDSEESKTYQKREQWSWFSSLLTTIVGILATVIASIIPELWSLSTPKATPPLLGILGVAAGSIFTLIISTLIVRQLRKGSSKARSLKRKLESAFLQALDGSSINPNSLTGDDNVRYFQNK